MQQQNYYISSAIINHSFCVGRAGRVGSSTLESFSVCLVIIYNSFFHSSNVRSMNVRARERIVFVHFLFCEKNGAWNWLLTGFSLFLFCFLPWLNKLMQRTDGRQDDADDGRTVDGKWNIGDWKCIKKCIKMNELVGGFRMVHRAQQTATEAIDQWTAEQQTIKEAAKPKRWPSHWDEKPCQPIHLNHLIYLYIYMIFNQKIDQLESRKSDKKKINSIRSDTGKMIPMNWRCAEPTR